MTSAGRSARVPQPFRLACRPGAFARVTLGPSPGAAAAHTPGPAPPSRAEQDAALQALEVPQLLALARLHAAQVVQPDGLVLRAGGRGGAVLSGRWLCASGAVHVSWRSRGAGGGEGCIRAQRGIGALRRPRPPPHTRLPRPAAPPLTCSAPTSFRSRRASTTRSLLIDTQTALVLPAQKYWRMVAAICRPLPTPGPEGVSVSRGERGGRCAGVPRRLHRRGGRAAKQPVPPRLARGETVRRLPLPLALLLLSVSPSPRKKPPRTLPGSITSWRAHAW